MRQQWVVGGSVRDVILNLQPKDVDFCWTGATPDDMQSFGFSRVGASFPVYLDKEGNEHALARQERKIAVGYNGFECNFDTTITIEDDLERRDLNCNSLAVRIEDWDTFVTTKDVSLVVDPFGGISDLRAGILRHTSDAFSEDPIRVLRVARLSARYNFTVHPDTIELMRKVVPELYTVPQERVWTEFEKGLMEKHPAEMFKVLQQCGALTESGPLRSYSSVNIGALDRVCDMNDVSVRFALVSKNFWPHDYEKCRIPTDCAQVSNTFNGNVDRLTGYVHLPTPSRLYLLGSLRALNDDWLVTKCLQACECLGRPSAFENIKFNMMKDIAAAKSVDCESIAATCSNGQEIKQKIFDARVKAMEKV